MLSVSEGRLLMKLQERRGSFGLFEGSKRIGDHLFHPSTVISAPRRSSSVATLSMCTTSRPLEQRAQTRKRSPRTGEHL